jgi:hypothetical protein
MLLKSADSGYFLREIRVKTVHEPEHELTHLDSDESSGEEPSDLEVDHVRDNSTASGKSESAQLPDPEIDDNETRTNPFDTEDLLDRTLPVMNDQVRR